MTSKVPGDINVRRKQGGGWLAEMYLIEDDRTVRVTKSGETQEVARRNLRIALRKRAAEAGREPLSPSTPLSEAARRYFDAAELRVAPTTLYTYRTRYNVLIEPRLGSRTLGSLTIPALNRAFDEMESEGLTTARRQAARKILGLVLAMAVAHGALPANPVREIERIRAPRRKRPRAFNAEERRAILEVCDKIDEQWPAREIGVTVRFMLATGMRIGEVLATTWGDADLSVPEVTVKGNIVRVCGKGLIRHEGKTEAALRTIRIPRGLATMLREVHDSRNPSPLLKDPIFPNKNGAWRDPKQVTDWMREVFHLAGLDWGTSHTLRKTCATILDEAGLSAREIADVLGHSDPSLTQNVYLGRGQETSKAAAVLEGLFDGS